MKKERQEMELHKQLKMFSDLFNALADAGYRPVDYTIANDGADIAIEWEDPTYFMVETIDNQTFHLYHGSDVDCFLSEHLNLDDVIAKILDVSKNCPCVSIP